MISITLIEILAQESAMQDRRLLTRMRTLNSEVQFLAQLEEVRGILTLMKNYSVSLPLRAFLL